VVTPHPLPTYPNGFPPEVVARLSEVIGRGVIGNVPSEGIAALESFGPEHLETGALIVYTSADSVLQIAGHEDVIAEADLHEACALARGVMTGADAVGRVIARPFTGIPGGFERTEGRRDFALTPPGRSYMQELQDAGLPVHTVGKVGQVFDGVGVDREHPGATNRAAIASTSELIATLDEGFVFTNLVETDQVYGHRQDIAGFHGALREIDAAVARWLPMLHPEADLFVLTADHGCDPTTPGTDHTREYAPLLAVFGGHEGRRHDGPLADVGATVTRWLTGREVPDLPGISFAA
jgi:phosphopentomutase